MFPEEFFPTTYFARVFFPEDAQSVAPASVINVRTGFDGANVSSVLFFGPGPSLAQDASFSWDNGSKALDIGAATISAFDGFSGPGAGLTTLNADSLSAG